MTPRAEDTGRRVLAALDRGRERAIENARRDAADALASVAALVAADLAGGGRWRGMPKRIARHFPGRALRTLQRDIALLRGAFAAAGSVPGIDGDTMKQLPVQQLPIVIDGRTLILPGLAVLIASPRGAGKEPAAPKQSKVRKSK